MIENLLCDFHKEIGSSNNDNVTFLGEEDDFITYSAFRTLTRTTSYGTLNQRTGLDLWLRFVIANVEIVIPKVAISYNITFNQIYQAGLAYGTDDNGIYVPYYYYNTSDVKVSPVNQYSTFTIQNKIYKIRLMKGSNPGFDPLTGANPPVNIDRSEFSRLFLPILADGQSLTPYTDKRLANYTVYDLGLSNKLSSSGNGASGFYCFCQERYNNPIRGIYYDRIAPYQFEGADLKLGTTSCWSLNTSFGWRPVLELVS